MFSERFKALKVMLLVFLGGERKEKEERREGAYFLTFSQI